MPSANIGLRKNIEHRITNAMLLIKRLKKRGPNWDPWGIPNETLKGIDVESLYFTIRVLFLR